MNEKYETHEHDVLIIGAGGAGLRAAIEASQRRIDAVMAAIREQISDNSPYGSNGRVKAQMASYARNVQI